jgi:hypothetical protein
MNTPQELAERRSLMHRFETHLRIRWYCVTLASD